MHIVLAAPFHLRLKDNDIIITVGAAWEHIQEDLKIGRRHHGASDAHDAVAARLLFALSKQLAASKHRSS